MSAELQSVPIRLSLIRPRLIAGAERELFLTLGLVCAAMIFVSLSWASAIGGVLLWASGTYVLREMAKADPMMSRIYARHRMYQPYYLARSSRTVMDKSKRLKKCWR